MPTYIRRGLAAVLLAAAGYGAYVGVEIDPAAQEFLIAKAEALWAAGAAFVGGVALLFAKFQK